MSDQTIRNILSDATTLHWQFHAMEEKIEKLDVENARLREALEKIAAEHGAGMGVHRMSIQQAKELARAALEGKE